MDDYSALAYRIAGGVADVRGCLILSRDGLILGSYPDDETAVKPAWVRFASLGDPERSFVEFGDQVWVYVRRPAYGAFAVANAGIRPGLVIDQLENILASAEESRNRRDTLRVPEASGGPAAKPHSPSRPSGNGSSSSTPPAPDSAEARHWSRTTPPAADGASAGSLKGEPAKVASGVGRSGDATPADGPTSDPKAKADADPGDDPKAARSAHGGDADGDADPKENDAEQGSSGEGSGTHNGKAADAPAPMELDADAEVDPVMLAKEFSGLLQVESGDDEASS
jgi:hypothetical protein